MSTPDSSAKCPQCGAPLPADAPAGLCPRCLMALNFGAETAFTGEPAAGPKPPLAPDEIAPHFPQLEILELLGRGGMGVVYKARQKSLGRLVALKLLAPEREKDPHFAERFTHEAQALAKLDHPHIVTVYDFGQTNGFFYLLMEFVDGLNLRELLRARKLTPEEALAIVPPLCEALQFAHARGIVHRDIKPENLLLARDGAVKIADFGIAKMLGAEAQAEEEKAAGTPGYMAPEQMQSPPRVDQRADIYSLGVVLYEMLTGELPATPIDPPSRKVQVDVRIDHIVLRALEQEPERRYQTVDEVRAAVTAVALDAPTRPNQLRDPETPAHPRRRIGCMMWLLIAITALLLLLGFGLVVPYFLRMRATDPGRGEAIRDHPVLIVPGEPGAAMEVYRGRKPGAAQAGAPAGAEFTREAQYAIDQDSRVMVELFTVINDGQRQPLGEKLVFKTPVGSSLGVKLRWHGYGASHPSHPNIWILELVNPNTGATFHHVEGHLHPPVRMLPLEGQPPGQAEPNSLMQPGSSTTVHVLRMEGAVPASEPVRNWSVLEADVRWATTTSELTPPEFQLPAVESTAKTRATPNQTPQPGTVTESELSGQRVKVAQIRAKVEQLEQLQPEAVSEALRELGMENETALKNQALLRQAKSDEAELRKSGLDERHPRVVSIRARAETLRAIVTEELNATHRAEAARLAEEEKLLRSMQEQFAQQH